jgi:hypothetical protein
MQQVPHENEQIEQAPDAEISAAMPPQHTAERWVFACGTEFHLFVAYVLRCMAPPTCHCTLVLHLNHRTAAFAEGAEQAGVWDKVVIAQEGHEAPDQALLSLEAGEKARFFYFSWGFPALTRLFAEAVRQGWTICLADEGLLSYQPQTSLHKWLALGPEHAEIASGYDYSAVSEIWLMSPWLFLEQTHAQILPIDAPAFIEKLRANPEATATFRRFFRVDEGWSCRGFPEIVYLRQYFSALGTLAEPLDAYLDCEFRGVLNHFDVCIKDHPGYRNSAYDETGAPFDYKGPLEALVVARMVAGEPLPEWIVSPISSAVINCAMLGAGKYFVFLYKILERYCEWVGPDRDDLLTRCTQSLPGKQFLIPETWDDYTQFINNRLAEKSVEAAVICRTISRDLRVMNAMLLEQGKAAKQREYDFDHQRATWQADEQRRLSDTQQAHEAREAQQRQELAGLQQRLETQRTQEQEREEQRSQQAEQQIQALQLAAAARAEELQAQVAALQQDLLERERAFTQQWTTWQADEQRRLSDTQQAHEAREAQQRRDAQAQIDTLRETIKRHADLAHAFAERMAALQATWWWRLSVPWRRPSKWPDVARPSLQPVQAEVLQHQVPLAASTSSTPTTKPPE